MKELWVKLKGNWEKIKPFVTTALESGIDVLVAEKENVEKIKELGRGIKVASEGGGEIKILKIEKREDLKNLKEKDCALIKIDRKEKEELAVEAGKKAGWVLVESEDWKIIPLENLVARMKEGKLLAFASDIEEIKLNLGVLEKGVDGIVFLPNVPQDIKRAREILNQFSKEKIELSPAKIVKIQPIGMGDRVCVDTVAILKLGEGLLVGSQSNGFFLVHSETLENPYVEPRPFRVNAGAVHSYVKVPRGKTKYLCEIKAGDKVLVVDKNGESREEVVGRVKIERRPLILIEAERKGKKINVILQNAETISLVKKEGTPVSVSKLKEGDEVLVNIEEGGRHFGIKVKEKLLEK
ncbi:MAG TPA: 3-dehydroquinate synthase II [bacterium]|nr:3-dehydroquinate synthase II [bacterium]HEX68223.1 3-dehydroquinate synthase II [bacterium]